MFSTYLLRISSKLWTGNKWWYDLAKCGDDTSVSPHTSQSLGSSQTFEAHRGQMYPVLVSFEWLWWCVRLDTHMGKISRYLPNAESRLILRLSSRKSHHNQIRRCLVGCNRRRWNCIKQQIFVVCFIQYNSVCALMISKLALQSFHASSLPK